MELSVNKAGNHVLTFVSPINVDNGIVNVPQGTKTSTMELFVYDGSTHGEGGASIEWIVGNCEFVENIGLQWEDGKLTDYDGVFELPKEVVKLLEKIEVTVPSEFFE